MNFGNIILGVVLVLAGIAGSLATSYLFFYNAYGDNNLLYFIGSIAAIVIGYKIIKAE